MSVLCNNNHTSHVLPRSLGTDFACCLLSATHNMSQLVSTAAAVLPLHCSATTATMHKCGHNVCIQPNKVLYCSLSTATPVRARLQCFSRKEPQLSVLVWAIHIRCGPGLVIPCKHNDHEDDENNRGHRVDEPAQLLPAQDRGHIRDSL